MDPPTESEGTTEEDEYPFQSIDDDEDELSSLSEDEAFTPEDLANELKKVLHSSDRAMNAFMKRRRSSNIFARRCQSVSPSRAPPGNELGGDEFDDNEVTQWMRSPPQGERDITSWNTPSRQASFSSFPSGPPPTRSSPGKPPLPPTRQLSRMSMSVPMSGRSKLSQRSRSRTPDVSTRTRVPKESEEEAASEDGDGHTAGETVECSMPDSWSWEVGSTGSVAASDAPPASHIFDPDLHTRIEHLDVSSSLKDYHKIFSTFAESETPRTGRILQLPEHLPPLPQRTTSPRHLRPRTAVPTPVSQSMPAPPPSSRVSTCVPGRRKLKTTLAESLMDETNDAMQRAMRMITSSSARRRQDAARRRQRQDSPPPTPEALLPPDSNPLARLDPSQADPGGGISNSLGTGHPGGPGPSGPHGLASHELKDKSAPGRKTRGLQLDERGVPKVARTIPLHIKRKMADIEHRVQTILSNPTACLHFVRQTAALRKSRRGRDRHKVPDFTRANMEIKTPTEKQSDMQLLRQSRETHFQSVQRKRRVREKREKRQLKLETKRNARRFKQAEAFQQLKMDQGQWRQVSRWQAWRILIHAFSRQRVWQEALHEDRALRKLRELKASASLTEQTSWRLKTMIAPAERHQNAQDLANRMLVFMKRRFLQKKQQSSNRILLFLQHCKKSGHMIQMLRSYRFSVVRAQRHSRDFLRASRVHVQLLLVQWDARWELRCQSMKEAFMKEAESDAQERERQEAEHLLRTVGGNKKKQLTWMQKQVIRTSNRVRIQRAQFKKPPPVPVEIRRRLLMQTVKKKREAYAKAALELEELGERAPFPRLLLDAAEIDLLIQRGYEEWEREDRRGDGNASSPQIAQPPVTAFAQQSQGQPGSASSQSGANAEGQSPFPLTPGSQAAPMLSPYLHTEDQTLPPITPGELATSHSHSALTLAQTAFPSASAGPESPMPRVPSSRRGAGAPLRTSTSFRTLVPPPRGPMGRSRSGMLPAVRPPGTPTKSLSSRALRGHKGP